MNCRKCFYFSYEDGRGEADDALNQLSAYLMIL